jgi:hypothetical protein
MTDLYQQFEHEAAEQEAFERSLRSSLGIAQGRVSACRGNVRPQRVRLQGSSVWG